MVAGESTLAEDIQDVLDECLAFMFTLETQIKNAVASPDQNADNTFDASELWSRLEGAAAQLSKEATVFSLAFCNRQQIPDAQSVKILCDKVQTPCVVVISIFLNALPTYPIHFGESCWKQLTGGILELVQSARRLVVSVKSPDAVNRQMQDTGTVFEVCDKIGMLPKNAKECLVKSTAQNVNLISDALRELEDHQKELEEEIENNDLRAITSTIIALVRATKATVNKIDSAVKQANHTGVQVNTELDILSVKMDSLSPKVDDLAAALYMIDSEEATVSCLPPNSEELGLTVSELLDKFTFSPHIFNEQRDKERVEFLRSALDHNMKKMKDQVNAVSN